MATEITRECLDQTDVRLRDTDLHDYNGDRDRIVELAGRGFSAHYISQATGVAYKTVQRLLRSEFVERNSKRQDTVQAHAQTLNWLKLKVTERIHKSGANWDRRDCELLLKVLEREAKVFGVDAPTQHQHDINVTVEDLSEEDLLSQLAAAGYALQITPPVRQLPTPVVADDAEFEPVDRTDGRQGTAEETGGQDPPGE